LFFSKTGLLDLQGVTNIETVGGNFYISDNDQLFDLNGLENLRIVGGSLSVSNNDSLESLHGIATLDSIYGGLSISSNLMLQSITGLVGLKYIGSYVSIVGNTELGNCHSSYLCKILPDKYDFIRSNLPGCNSKTEILSQCDCPLDITLSNGDGLHYASNSITTSGNIQIGLFSELNSQTVSIQPEFVVPLGAVLLINNFGCTND